MEFRKFDLSKDNIDKTAELVISAYSHMGETAENLQESSHSIKDTIRIGNNFLGHENIYLAIEDNTVHGLLIAYKGKSRGQFKTAMNLLLKLRLNELLGYLLVTSNLFHLGFTPDLHDDDFYISVLVVDENSRNRGTGGFLLSNTIELAKTQSCKRVILDVDKHNEPALALYDKFGFKVHSEFSPAKGGALPAQMYKMQLELD